MTGGEVLMTTMGATAAIREFLEADWGEIPGSAGDLWRDEAHFRSSLERGAARIGERVAIDWRDQHRLTLAVNPEAAVRLGRILDRERPFPRHIDPWDPYGLPFRLFGRWTVRVEDALQISVSHRGQASPCYALPADRAFLIYREHVGPLWRNTRIDGAYPIPVRWE